MRLGVPAEMLNERVRELCDFDGPYGPTAKHRMPVALGAPGDRRQKCDVVTENLSDGGGLILTARAQPAMVQLLQGHEIRRLLRNDPGDAPRRNPPVRCRCSYGRYSS